MFQKQKPGSWGPGFNAACVRLGFKAFFIEEMDEKLEYPWLGISRAEQQRELNAK
jgi:hypothetical protein